MLQWCYTFLRRSRVFHISTL